MRLTTVREYAPLLAAFSGKDADPTIAFIYFFLDTTVRMRLDRLDGVGEAVWLEDFAVAATVNGLFEGLRLQEKNGNGNAAVRTDALLSLMQSFDKPELAQVFNPLLAYYAEQDSNDMDLIGAHVADHLTLLHHTIQNFH